ncbi:MAG: hypothetical protein H7A51_02505 [Akkermansiaceae bacterium]|nr:hypothetical protein [Akkermansiaceae bacterium]
MKFPAKVILFLAFFALGYIIYPWLFDATPGVTDEKPAEKPRPVPAAQPLTLPAPAPLTALFNGGGATPLSQALVTTTLPEPDERGLPWTAMTYATFTKPFTLNDTSLYLVVKPEKAEQSSYGLIAGGARAYDNFIMLEHHQDNTSRFRSETRTGGSNHQNIAPDAHLAQDAPRLIEFHPDGEGKTNIAINGIPAATIKSDIAATTFGGGYAGNQFRGHVGQIAAYQNLTPIQRKTISQQLRAWWQLDNNSAYPAPHREQPTLANRDQAVVSSAGLTLQLTDPAESTPCYLAASPAAPFDISEVHSGITLINGRSWHLSTPENTTANLSFAQSDTIPANYLGENGFYALLSRPTADAPWQEVATTSATADGKINFANLPLTTAIYTLGVIQGAPVSASPATLAVNGEPISETTTITPGQYLTLTAAQHAPGQSLTLTDAASGMTWFDGPAADLKLTFHALRSDLSLIARFSDASNILGNEKPYQLKLDAATPPLYPGLLAKIIRLPGEPGEIPADRAFVPHASWPTGLTHLSYPAFRTSPSIHTPPFDDVTKPWFALPSYFHTVLPSLQLVDDRETIIAARTPHNFPLGDLKKSNPVSAHIAGQLLIDQAGSYTFELTHKHPVRFSIAGKTITTSEKTTTLTVDLSAGSAPVSLTFNHPAEAEVTELRVRWKKPGDDAFSDVPAALLSHSVEAERLAPYQQFVGNFDYRTLRISTGDDGQTLAVLESLKTFDPEAHSSNNEDFIAALTPLTEAFGHSGDLRFATAAFDLIRARMQFIRKTPEQIEAPRFGKTYGKLITLHVSLRGFLGTCENHPALQKAALATRADLVSYTSSTCLSRPCFTEEHSGTNDGYGDNDNLLVNFWRGAEAIDSPYALDAAASLQDSHFRYAAGRGEGLHADGIWAFHNANGRHIHMGGYGINWFDRVSHGRRLGTPWGYTPEQYRRLANYLLAYEWVFYKNTSSFHINGRHNTHHGNASILLGRADKLLSLPETAYSPDTRQQLVALKQRIESQPDNSITGHHFFYRNLLTLHRRKDYYIDSKMTSPLSGPTETFAGHRFWNMNFGDGSYTLMRSSNEYDNIHRNNPNGAIAERRKITGDLSFWQYRALPGSTMCDDEIYSFDRYRKGAGDAAGGVSDGELGHAAFLFENNKFATSAHKFYAFLTDGIAVLNTGINFLDREKDASRNPTADCTIRSNINQTDWTGPVTIHTPGQSPKTIPLASGDQTLRMKIDRPYLITHAGIAYLILPTGKEAGTSPAQLKPNDPLNQPDNPVQITSGAGYLELQLVTRNPFTPVPGDPEKSRPHVAQAIASGEIPNRSAKVLHLSIDHGPRPVDASCAYLVSMRAEHIDPAQWLAKAPVEVLSNTRELQAVTDTRDGTTHAFFHLPGELKNAQGTPLITTPTAAAIMWRKDKQTVTVQDPTAACLSEQSKMIDTFKATLHPALTGLPAPRAIAIPLRGSNDPDDRYRGKPETRELR